MTLDPAPAPEPSPEPFRRPLIPLCECAAPVPGRTVSGLQLCAEGHALAIRDERSAQRVLRPPPEGQRYMNRRERRAMRYR